MEYRNITFIHQTVDFFFLLCNLFLIRDLQRLTMDVIGCCGFGIDVNSIENPDDEFLNNGRDVLQRFEMRRGPTQFIMPLMCKSKLL